MTRETLLLMIGGWWIGEMLCTFSWCFFITRHLDWSRIGIIGRLVWLVAIIFVTVLGPIGTLKRFVMNDHKRDESTDEYIRKFQTMLENFGF